MRIEIDPQTGWVTLRFMDSSKGAVIIQSCHEAGLHVELLELPDRKTAVSAISAHSVSNLSYLSNVLNELKSHKMAPTIERGAWDRLRLICLNIAVLNPELSHA